MQAVSDHGPFVQTLWPVDAVPRRLVRRDYPFHQSGDKIHMHRSGWKLTELRQIAMLDWFHVRASNAVRCGAVRCVCDCDKGLCFF